MHSVLIPGLPVQTFGLCVAIGVFAAWTVAEKLSGRKDIGSLIFLLAVCGIAGARTAHVVEYWHKDGFASNLLSIFAIWKGGLVFYGGFAGAVAGFAVWCLVKRQKPLAVADIVATVLPLGHAFGRIGCFFHGCCWGKVSNSPLAVTFPPDSPVYAVHKASFHAARSLPVLPVQLFESAALFALFAVLYFVYRKKKAYTAGLYLCSYGVIRFFMEYLRDDERPQALGLSSAQLFSIPLAITGVLLLAFTLMKHANRDDNNR